MKKRLLVICALLLFLVMTGCVNKENKLMKCSKKEPFDDTQIEWTSNVELKFDSDEKVENALIKHVIKIDPSVKDERKEEFKNSIYAECSNEPGANFDICDILADGNTYTVKLSTSNLTLFDSAISKNDEQDLDTNAKLAEIKNSMESKGYSCEVE